MTMAGDAVFPYPGGKSQYADFITQNLPEHTAYVELFGGGAGVLFNKSESKVEVYNDLDGDITQFFKMLRDRPDELVDWLRRVPFSRELFEDWRTDFYHDDERPDDPIERAGRFFYLRYTQFSGRYNRAVSMSTSTASGSGTNVPKKFTRKRERLMEFARRFDGVLIENQSFEQVIDRYDDPTTVFYADPPYYGKEDEYYRVASGFDHSDLAEALDDAEGYWLTSYKEIPPAFEDIAVTVATRERRYSMGSGGKGDGDQNNTERLLMGFDPDQTPMMDDAKLTDVTKWGSN